jgi:hypothetical protein
MSIEMRIKGDKKTMAMLRNIKQGLKPTLEKSAKMSVTYVQSKLPPYPPQRPGQKYRRGQPPLSEKLGTSLTSSAGGANPKALSRVEDLGTDVVGIIGTAVSYTKRVIGDVRGLGQAWMHKGRWWILLDEVKKRKPGIKKIYQKNITDLIRKHNR